LDAEIKVSVFQNVYGRSLSSDLWQSWVMELENALGRDVEITIRVEDEASRLAVSRKETFSRGARKRLFFTLPSGGAGAMYGGSQPKYEPTVTIGVSRGRGGRFAPAPRRTLRHPSMLRPRDPPSQGVA